MLPMMESPQFTLVLGGGGLKGLTHIGVLRALAERNLVPQAVIGCSMGSFVAAAWVMNTSRASGPLPSCSATRMLTPWAANTPVTTRAMLAFLA